MKDQTEFENIEIKLKIDDLWMNHQEMFYLQIDQV